MKKFLRTIASFISITIGIVLALIFSIGYLFFIPFDIIRYHHMPYYRNLKKKYHLFITSSDVVKFYNQATKKQIPFEYFQSEHAEYFVKDSQVLLCGWGNESFECTDGRWSFTLTGECETTIPMNEALEQEKKSLLPNHQEMDAKFLIFYSDITDAEQFELAKTCPHFYCVFSPDEEI